MRRRSRRAGAARPCLLVAQGGSFAIGAVGARVVLHGLRIAEELWEHVPAAMEVTAGVQMVHELEQGVVLEHAAVVDRHGLLDSGVRAIKQPARDGLDGVSAK